MVFQSDATNYIGDSAPGGVLMKNLGDGSVIRLAPTATVVSPGGGTSTNLYLTDISGDGTKVIFGTGSTVKLWNAGTTSTLSSSGILFNFDMSDNGRYVAVENSNSGFVLFDLQAGGSTPIQISAFSFPRPMVTNDGQIVYSSGGNIFARDSGGTVTQITHALGGGNPDSSSDLASISSNGRFVLFGSSATNLVAGDTNGHRDVFRYDAQTHVTERVSTNLTGGEFALGAQSAGMSGDGRFVAYTETDNVGSGVRLYVKDMVDGITKQIDLPVFSGIPSKIDYYARLSSDGSTIEIMTSSPLVPGDGGSNDVYVVHNPLAPLASGGVDTARVTLGSAGQTYVLGANVENLELLGTLATNGDGNAQANMLKGNGAANLLRGLDGNDVLIGGGNDTLQGGGGNDTYDLSAGAGTVTVIEDANAGLDTVIIGRSVNLGSGADVALFANIENVTLAGATGFSATGNDLANLLTGNAGANVLDGGAGKDTLIGGAGNDTYRVDNTADVVVEAAAGGVADVVESSATAFTLSDNVEKLILTGIADIAGTGSAQANRITGNAGKNLIDGGAGNDTMTGLAGDDTYVVDAAGDVVIEVLGGGTDTIRSSISIAKLADNVENLILTGALAIDGTGNGLDNTITGNNAANLLDGGLGNDTLDGAGGNDTFIGGAGSDSMIGGTGNDTYDLSKLTGTVTIVEAAGLGNGRDTVIVGRSVDLSTGPDVAAFANIENITLSGTGAFNATGDGAANVLTGNSAANVLDGGVGTDTMIGGAGNDTYLVDNATDRVIEDDKGGIDLVRSMASSYTLAANVENLTLDGVANSNGTGNTLANLITGNVGNNLLNGAGGVDTLVGGGGDDTYVIADAGVVVTEIDGGGTDTIRTSVTLPALAAQIENLVLVGTLAIDGIGNAGDNTITGNSAANLLDGGGGTDVLVGGLGNDTYVVDGAEDVITELEDQGVDTVRAGYSFTLGNNLENLVLTGAAALSGTGDEGDNRITGNTAANVLDGGEGDDTLIGGGGNDALIGGGGNDVFDLTVGSGSVTLTEAVDGGIDTVIIAAAIDLNDDRFANIENATLAGAGAFSATGTNGDNVLTGNGAANTLNGGDGNDTLDGRGGADSLVGGDGDDVYVIDSVGDKISEGTGALSGHDSVRSSVSFTLGANLEDLELQGDAPLSGTGNTLSNRITGNDGANVIDGGGGTDTMIGGGGDDTYIVRSATDVVTEGLGVGDLHPRLVSTDGLGHQVNGDTFVDDISGDGRLVIFQGFASNYLPGTPQPVHQIYVKDTQTNAIKLISGTNGAAGPGLNLESAISNDGKYAVFAGDGALVAGDTNHSFDIYLSNLATGALTLVSHKVGAPGVGATAAQTPGSGSFGADISADGRYVSFASNQIDLVAGDTDGVADVFRYDRNTGAIQLVSTGGGAATLQTHISGDGRYVAFTTSSQTTPIPQPGDAINVWLKDMLTGNLTLMSADAGGTIGNGDSQVYDISANGRYVVILSLADNLVPGDTNHDYDVFLKDTQTGAIRRVSESADGGQDKGIYGSVSADGRYVVFAGEGSALVPGDTNNQRDLFVKDTVTGMIARVTLSDTGNQIPDLSADPHISADGRTITYSYAGSDLVAGDVNSHGDVFVVDNPLLNSVKGDEVRSSAQAYTLSDFVERLTLTGTANINGQGSAQGNVLTGNVGANLLEGMAGNDLLIGGGGNDTLKGGVGNDTYDLSSGSSAVSVVENADEGSDTVIIGRSVNLGSGPDATAFAGIENVTLSGAGLFNVFGSAVANLLTGNASANLLDGGAGNDTMIGGGGNDTYVVDTSGDVVIELAAGGAADVVQSGAATFTLPANVENLILTGGGDIAGTGNGLANRITGNAGGNLIDGGAGNDTMAGLGGNDTYVVDATGDVVTEVLGGGIDTIRSSVTLAKLADNVEKLVLTGVATLNGTGNGLDNTITGNNAANTLDGGLGNDTIDGGIGNDSLVGGVGADSMIGGAGDDTFMVDNISDQVSEQLNQGTDTVIASVSFTLAANIENLLLTGTALAGTGNSSDNRIVGTAGANTLAGGDGSDTLTGGAGNDTLTGGNGFDRFVFDGAPSAANVDTITDFTHFGDQLVLDGSVFKIGVVNAALPDAMMHAGAGFTSATTPDQRLIYNSDNGNLYYDADGSGATAKVLLAVLGAGALHPATLSGTDVFVTA